jgi:hypothetical protein
MTARLWRKMCSTASRAAFSAYRTDTGDWLATSFSRPARSRSDRLRRASAAGYPSRVCSITGEAIDRIAEAIDQLASDAQRQGSEADLAARVADIWLMVTALDPELARRQRGYTASAPADDDTPPP